MTKKYQKECMYCKQQITMSDESGKWLPYNKDGSAHDCRTTNGKTKSNNDKQETIIDITGQPGQKEPTIGQLKIWIDRLEKVGVHIDINEILNPKKDQKEKEKQK